MDSANNNNVVFLFGAGAVLDWGAPLTLCDRVAYEKIPEHDTGEIYNRPCCLTHLMLVIGFKTSGGDRITQRIYDRLKEKDPNATVNFETILNILEDLYSYWSSRTGKAKTNMYAIVDVDELLADLHDFQVEHNERAHVYKLTVPGFTLYDADMVHDDIDPHVKYYELFINELLSGILGHVSKYAYATNTKKQFENNVNSGINANFRKWMQTFVEKGSNPRLYTLNYDDIFKRLMQQENLKVFDGFFPGSGPEDYNAAPNLKRIVTNFSDACHLNLHGSWFWEVDDLNENHLPGYRYRKSIAGAINASVASIEIEKGRRILLTNIISGYQKVQKTAISPFRQFFSALDVDCLQAAELYLVGYSYGDEHVNDIIRNARRNNPKLRITLINPFFDNLKFALDFLSNWGPPELGVYEKLSDTIIIARRFNVLIVKEKFGDFLTKEASGRPGFWQ